MGRRSRYVRRGADDSIRHTLRLVILALILAFVFRTFVVEPFVIPTGSMAPTLRGAHTQQRDSANGAHWAVDVWERSPRSLEDHLTALDVPEVSERVRAGDRILVLKQLYPFFSPRRWDVVVFKNPENSEENFIKRLVGMPGEQIWLVDGDVFTRRTDSEPWSIRRKSDRVQRHLWAPVFSSEWAPTRRVDGEEWSGPWDGAHWNTTGTSYRTERDDQSVLAWNSAATTPAGDQLWPIQDWVAYNANPADGNLRPGPYPVSDIRMRAVVRPDGPGFAIRATLQARTHQFEGVVDSNGNARIRMREDWLIDGEEAPWRVLDESSIDPLPAGRATPVSLAHFDQRLELRVGDQLVASAEYDWSPAERLAFAMHETPEEFSAYALRDPDGYRRPAAWWTFEGSGVTLDRVGLDRDIYYQPSRGLGVSEDRIARLTPSEYFVLGDNSAASRDSRAWDRVDPWIGLQLDPPEGVVPDRLMMGKAFMVYFPAPHRSPRGLLAPDFGRVRFIR